MYLDKDTSVIYSDIRPIKYEKPTKNTIYFYDQGHTVGTDIKQPQTGHFAIIVDESTKISDFAQAIFRFRQLNRGTFMSVYMISNSMAEMTVDGFYKMISDNETVYNDNQKLGLSFQLMKTEVRKKSKDYRESDMIPEFMDGPYDDTRIETRMHNLIKGLREMKSDKNISKIYNDLVENKNKLRSLVVGSGHEIQTNFEMEKNIESGKSSELGKNNNDSIFNNNECYDFIKKLCIDYYSCINIHKNCDGCKINNGTRFFNTMNNEYKINRKDVYISYNLLCYKPQYIVKEKYTSELIKHDDKYYVCDRISFVEFENYVLIENEYVAVHIYAGLFPVYDYNGSLINPTLPYIHLDENKLIIHQVFASLLGLKGSGKYPISTELLKNAADDVTLRAKILLKFNIIVSSVSRFNLSDQLVRVLLDLDEKIFSDDYVIDMTEQSVSHQTTELVLPIPILNVWIGKNMNHIMCLVNKRIYPSLLIGGGPKIYHMYNKNKNMYMKLKIY